MPLSQSAQEVQHAAAECVCSNVNSSYAGWNKTAKQAIMRCRGLGKNEGPQQHVQRRLRACLQRQSSMHASFQPGMGADGYLLREPAS